MDLSSLRAFFILGVFAITTTNPAAEPSDRVIFSINVQDFAHPNESVATLRRGAAIGAPGHD